MPSYAIKIKIICNLNSLILLASKKLKISLNFKILNSNSNFNADIWKTKTTLVVGNCIFCSVAHGDLALGNCNNLTAA